MGNEDKKTSRAKQVISYVLAVLMFVFIPWWYAIRMYREWQRTKKALTIAQNQAVHWQNVGLTLSKYAHGRESNQGV